MAKSNYFNECKNGREYRPFDRKDRIASELIVNETLNFQLRLKLRYKSEILDIVRHHLTEQIDEYFRLLGNGSNLSRDHSAKARSLYMCRANTSQTVQF